MFKPTVIFIAALPTSRERRISAYAECTREVPSSQTSALPVAVGETAYAAKVKRIGTLLRHAAPIISKGLTFFNLLLEIFRNFIFSYCMLQH